VAGSPAIDVLIAACARHHGFEVEHDDSHFDFLMTLYASTRARRRGTVVGQRWHDEHHTSTALLERCADWEMDLADATLVWLAE
jgi:hypothetical protein